MREAHELSSKLENWRLEIGLIGQKDPELNCKLENCKLYLG